MLEQDWTLGGLEGFPWGLPANVGAEALIQHSWVCGRDARERKQQEYGPER